MACVPGVLNGINSYKQVDWASDFQLELFTDSAGSENLGCGAILELIGPF